jgi:PAS domain S-box-containing protein
MAARSNSSGSAESSGSVFAHLMPEQIFEFTHMGVFVYDLDQMRHLYANSAAERILGYSLAELQELDARGFLPAIHPEDLPFIDAHLPRLREGAIEGPVPVECRLTRADGQTAWLQGTLSRMPASDPGQPARVLGFLDDVTELKTAQARTQETFEQMVRILDGLEVIVYVVDMETYEVLYINDYTRQDVGEAEGKICWQVFQAGQDGPCEFCTNEVLLDEDGQPSGPHIWEFQNTRINRWYKIMDKAIPWKDGRTVRLEIATDITDLKNSAAEKEKLIGELEAALQEVKTLQGIIPICSYCKKIRDDSGYWSQVESYLQKQTAAEFSHGICPDCVEKHFPGMTREKD